MENLILEVTKSGDISMNGKDILVCFSDCEKISTEIVNRVNEYPFLIEKINKLNTHIELLEKGIEESLKLNIHE